MPEYRSIHALHHDRYAKGGGIRHEAEYLERGARMMLSKTKIVPNLPRAKVLIDVLEGLPPATDAQTQERMFDVFGLLTDCYEPIADDVLILAAFEIHAKTELLRRGYAIHEVKTPGDLGKKQRKSPVHVRTIRALARRGTAPHSRTQRSAFRTYCLQATFSCFGCRARPPKEPSMMFESEEALSISVNHSRGLLIVRSSIW